MKINFEGWSRRVFAHRHEAQNVVLIDKHTVGPVAGPVTWDGPMQAQVKLEKLGLSGDFLVTLAFEPEELRSWLTAYVAEDPKGALAIIDSAVVEGTKRFTTNALALIAREVA